MVSRDFGLTLEQRPAIEIFDAPLAFTAGAGSGKTRILVERFLALVTRGIDPKRILTVTFTNEAADELRTRIIKALNERGASLVNIESVENSPWIGTIHSFCYRVFEQYGSLLGKERIESITDDFELVSLFHERYEAWFSQVPDVTLDGLLRHFTPADLKEIAEVLFLELYHFKSTVSLLKDPTDLGNRMLKRLETLLAPMVTALRSELHTAASYTFNDLETYSAELIQGFPLVKSRLITDFDFLLVDEFQDTSRLQWSILKEVVGNDWKRLFIVGDPKQSIYSFRHAEVALFQEVSRAIAAAGGLVQTLSLNFRTQSNLLDGINAVSRDLFEMSTVPFSDMKAGRTDCASPVEKLHYRVSTDTSRQQCQDLERESILTAVSSRLRDGARPEDITLLFRNSDRMLEYSRSLELLGHSTYTEITSNLFESYEILDLVHFLEALDRPHDSHGLSAFLLSPSIALNPDVFHAMNLERTRQNVPLIETLKNRRPLEIEWFLTLLDTTDLTLSDALNALFIHTGKFPDFHEGFLTLLRPLLDAPTLQEATKRLRVWKKQGVMIRRTLGSKATAIRLMTVHAAKGLEFAHVFLADCLRQTPNRQPPLLIAPGHPTGLKFRQDDEFQYSESYETLWRHLREREEEEAKRILYVALTRARESLTICLPKGMKSVPKGSWAAMLEGPKQKGTSAPGETSAEVPL